MLVPIKYIVPRITASVSWPTTKLVKIEFVISPTSKKESTFFSGRYASVSYTHLDVYKRQGQTLRLPRFGKVVLLFISVMAQKGE